AKKISAIRAAGRTMSSERSQVRERAGPVSSATSADAARTSVTAIADPRVEHGVEDVGREVGHHGGYGGHDPPGLRHDEVAGVNRLQEKLADPGQREDLF